MQLIAYRMLGRARGRFVFTIAGIAAAFFLTAAQVGLLIGWCRTNSAILRHSGASVWVMARQNPAFDYGTPIPQSTVYLVRSVPGVSWAEGMFMGWNFWQCPNGRRINIELVGLDDSCAGGPWDMKVGKVDSVHNSDTVVIDELYLKHLGVAEHGDEAEIMGVRARIGGICRGIRTFTAAPFVFTSLKSAILYDKRYRSDEVTYVLVRCLPGLSSTEVKHALATALPEFDVLTTGEFVRRTVGYWMLETGAGITVVLTAVLGLCIGTIIISQTLFAVTQDHLAEYGTLLAIGFSHRKLIHTVVLQAFILGGSGAGIGAALFFCASIFSQSTPIPLDSTPSSFLMLLIASLATAAAASLISVRSIFRIDPVSVFR